MKSRPISAVKSLTIIVLIGGVMLSAPAYFFPAPPKRITIATAFKGASFEFYGRRYKERLERLGLQVELRETAGAVENVKLLQDPKSGVDIAFVTGGVSDASKAPNILSLGTVYLQPYWIFYNAKETFTNFGQLKSTRIAVGPEGSGTKFSAEAVLGKVGVNTKTATMLAYAGNEAVEALDKGLVDAVWIIGSPRANAVQALLRNPQVKLMSIPLAEAFTRLMPDLVRLTLPQGVIDPENNMPPNDVTILASTTKIIVRNDIHPQIVYAMLRTMTEEHSNADIFHKSGEYPMSVDSEYPMAATAVEYYKNGPSFLHRHLPLWLTVHVQRFIALLIAAVAIGVPVFSYVPRVYRWALKHRTRILYGRIGVIEKALQTDLSQDQVIELQKEIESIDRAASALQLPRRHLDLLFGLKVHINLVRTRVSVRREEIKRTMASSAN